MKTNIIYKYNDKLSVKCELIENEFGLTLYSLDDKFAICVQEQTINKLYKEFREGITICLTINSINKG